MSDIDFSSNFIETSQIQIVTIGVTEKINPQFLQEFLKTTLEYKNILVDDTTLVWSNFIQEVSLYEIYIITTNNMINMDIYPNILYLYYDKTYKKDTIDLFILNEFFAVYKYGKLYCFKSIKESSNKDIENYITQTYKLTLDNIIQYDDAKFNELINLYKTTNHNKEKALFVKIKQNNSFLLFIVFSLISILIFFFLSFDTYNNRLDNLNNKLLKVQTKYNNLINKKITYGKVSPQLIELFKYIKLQNLITQKIVYEKNKIKLDLLHQNKTQLLNFLTIYSGNISIENIEFVKKEKLYKMVVQIEI